MVVALILLIRGISEVFKDRGRIRNSFSEGWWYAFLRSGRFGLFGRGGCRDKWLWCVHAGVGAIIKWSSRRILQLKFWRPAQRSRLLSFNKNVSVYTDNGSKKVKMMTMRKILGVRFKIFCLTIALTMQIKWYELLSASTNGILYCGAMWF